MLGLILGMGLLVVCCSYVLVVDGFVGVIVVYFLEVFKVLLKEGIYFDVVDLCCFVLGMSKWQLYMLLGMLYFNEGMWGVCEWNYLFNFCIVQGVEYFICQFQVCFDSKGIVQGGYWKLELCVVVFELSWLLVLLVLVLLLEQLLWLLVDVLFGFDSVVFSVEGQQVVQGILVQVCEVVQVQLIRVIGYIDCIGSVSYNQVLLQCCVDVVCNVLVQGGVFVVSISVEGCGVVELIVQCEQCNWCELIVCLVLNWCVQIVGMVQLY